MFSFENKSILKRCQYAKIIIKKHLKNMYSKIPNAIVHPECHILFNVFFLCVYSPMVKAFTNIHQISYQLLTIPVSQFMLLKKMKNYFYFLLYVHNSFFLFNLCSAFLLLIKTSSKGVSYESCQKCIKFWTKL